MKQLYTTLRTGKKSLCITLMKSIWCPIKKKVFSPLSLIFLPSVLFSLLALCSWNLPHYAVLAFAWCEQFPFSCRRYHNRPSLVQHLQGAMWNHTMHYSSFLLPEPTGFHNHLQHQVQLFYNYCMWNCWRHIKSLHSIKTNCLRILHKVKILQ